MAIQASAAPQTSPPPQAGEAPDPEEADLRSGKPAFPEPPAAEMFDQVDRLAPARGVIVGVALSAVFWGAVAVLILMLRR
jgi:hypothetical protein